MLLSVGSVVCLPFDSGCICFLSSGIWLFGRFLIVKSLLRSGDCCSLFFNF